MGNVAGVGRKCRPLLRISRGMRRTTMFYRLRVSLLSALVAVLLFAGCDSSDDAPGAGPFYGPAVAVGNGTARAYVRLDAAGVPEALGVVLTDAALTGLPDGDGHDGHSHDLMNTLRFPAEAAGLPFDHISFDWNPHGHEPEGLFTLPHFDVHFYMIPESERMNWTPADPQFAERGVRAPAERYIPAGFFSPPGNAPVPMMGMHWLDGSDPTYAPGGPSFTEVFLWGSYDGNVVFAEPMITKAFLESHPDYEETLAQPAAYARSGRYPTRYAIRYVAARGEYEIELGGLVQRTAG